MSTAEVCAAVSSSSANLDELDMATSSSSKQKTSYLNWAENIKFLLEDPNGVRLFKYFLNLENLSLDTVALDFYFAINGFRSQDNPDHMQRLMKLIVKKYLKGDLLRVISHDTRTSIMSRRHCRSTDTLDPHMFDEASFEVLHHLTQGAYTAFLRSDTYIRHVNSEGEYMPEEAGASLASQSANSRSLPTVHEDFESSRMSSRFYKQQPMFGHPAQPLPRSMSASSGCPSLDLTQHNLSVTQHLREAAYNIKSHKNTTSAALSIQPPLFYHSPHLKYPFNPALPYYSFVPGSKQDSELQSMSSDALTDDTISLTDSNSLDYSTTNRIYRRAMRRTSNLNREEHRHDLIPRNTDRTSHNQAEHDLAVTDPNRFADLLINKLNSYNSELSSSEDSSSVSNPVGVLNSPWAKRMLDKAEKSKQQENPEQILDNHLSHVDKRQWFDQQHNTNIGTKSSSSTTNKSNKSFCPTAIDSGFATISDKSKRSHISQSSSVSASINNNQTLTSQKQLNHHVTNRAVTSMEVPRQPMMIDTNMQLLGAPSTDNQLAEAKRRLEDLNLMEKSTTSSTTSNEQLPVLFFLPGESVPYRTPYCGHEMTLLQFKQLVARKGHYRYYFKKRSDEVSEGGAVFEEVTRDEEVLPLWDGKVIAKLVD